MKQQMRRVVVMFLACVAVLAACSKSDDGSGPGDPGAGGYDKTGMLTNYIDGIIIPQYAAMQQSVAGLQTASDAFLQAPGAATQAAVKRAYDSAYLQYERIAAFQFGPAETALQDLYLNYSGGLDYSFNTSGALTGFSVDTATIESNIASGSYNLAAANRSSFYAQGFPALGYLYFAPGAAGKFSTNGAQRVQYVRDVLERMKALIDGVAAGWKSGRGAFIANTKTDVGSPIGSIVNQMAYQLDLIKGPRIGWPLGKQSNGIAFPTKTEGFYSGISAALASEAMKSLKRIYTGGVGEGLSDYLVSLGHSNLNNDVLAQFDVAIVALEAIPDPMSATLTAQPGQVDAAYKQVQKMVTLIKTDVASATAVQINYMDNDGD